MHTSKTTYMIARLFSPKKVYYAKVLGITTAIILLLLKSQQPFTYPLLILILLCGGYYLGKITCSVHLKNTSITITLVVFVLMNIVHSFIDGISFTGQSFFYWLSAVGGHEAIRQPTLYIILWAILQPVTINTYVKIVICFLAVTGAWFIGIWLGKISGASVSHLYNTAKWVGYSIFLFIGDIAHHLIDQYNMIKRKNYVSS
jgi:hypothetical protein